MKRAILLAVTLIAAVLFSGCESPLEIKEVDQGKADRIIDEVENKTD